LTIASPRSLAVAADAAAYSRALAGFDLDVIRTGVGFGPNIVRNTNLPGVGLSSGAIQFPILGRSTIPDDRIVAVLVSSAPRGSRWCEIDLAPGTVLMYGPGAEHTGVSPAGLVYTLATIDWSRLEEATEWTGMPIERPARGQVVELQPTRNMRPLMAMLQSVADPRVPTADSAIARQDVLHAVAGALAGDPPLRWPGAVRRIDSRRVVTICIEYADTTGRNPSIPELCMVSHVSERRLRQAFIDTFDLPPSRYFRRRALDRARRRLIEGGRYGGSVTEVALDHGFTNMSRFARQYRATFGELPSETLSSRG
jgi:AraC family ethanolamine operon transcriptional activator